MAYIDLLAKREKAFRENGLNGLLKLHAFSLKIKGENLRLRAVTCRPAKNFLSTGASYQGYFERENCAHLKKNIVLHFTAGHLRGDIDTLTLPKKNKYGVYKTRHRVSVPFVIARDGTIYNLFSSKYWSWHLGKSPVVDRSADKKSIGIELSNVGYLTLQGNNLVTYYGQVYCTLDDTAHYTKLDAPFRGYVYFASFTAAQYDSLIVLLRYLTAQYNIPRAFISKDKRYETSAENATFRGITSHVNYRPADKWDIGTAFDWAKVIAGLTASSYGVSDLEGGFESFESVFTSEDAVETQYALPIGGEIQHNVEDSEDERGEMSYDPSDFE